MPRLGVVTVRDVGAAPQQLEQQRGKETRDTHQCRIALALTVIGGFVEAVGYITLYQLFVGNMSGNNIVAMVAVARGGWGEALFRGLPVLLFVLGVVAGAVTLEILSRRGVRSALAPILTVEILLLIGFAAWGQGVLSGQSVAPEPAGRFYALVALVTVAMGLQAASLRRAGGESVRTTTITSVICQGVEESVNTIFHLLDRRHADGDEQRAAAAEQARAECLRRATTDLGVWAAFIGGGILGGLAEHRWPMWSLVPPIVGLAAIAVADTIWPVRSGQENAANQER
jgi:uncharacterized membrane protein YoaK (UPF0700 family)